MTARPQYRSSSPFVIHGTPAFRANILEGNVILKINDADVIDAKGFSEQLTQYEGQPIELGIVRGTEPVTIRMTLQKPPSGS
jgi:S1-C subfamily serine protease